MYFVLGSIYVLIEENNQCDDKGHTYIKNETDCKKAGYKMGATAFMAETNEFYPKGCYVRLGAALFNRHSTGRRLLDAAPICIADGKIPYSLFSMVSFKQCPLLCLNIYWIHQYITVFFC